MSSRDEPSEPDRPSSELEFGLAVLGLLVLLYSFLVLTRPLIGALVVVLLFAVYLLWRFVRAVERIADAMDRRDGRM